MRQRLALHSALAVGAVLLVAAALFALARAS